MGNKPAKVQRDPKEVAKEQKKIVRGAKRKIDREMKNLERAEKKNLAEIKKLAAKGQHGPAKIMAKSVAQQRAQMTQMTMMNAQMTAIEM